MLIDVGAPIAVAKPGAEQQAALLERVKELAPIYRHRTAEGTTVGQSRGFMLVSLDNGAKGIDFQ